MAYQYCDRREERLKVVEDLLWLDLELAAAQEVKPLDLERIKDLENEISLKKVALRYYTKLAMGE